ncbi:MAG: hypothetical protein QW726_00345 [Fervidicoccaceae archaeon]
MRRKATEIINVLDSYIGDDVLEIIEEKMDDSSFALEDEYEHLMMYVYRSLVKSWFGGKEPDLNELKTKLRRYKSPRYYGRLKVLLSYLINRYSEIRRMELIRKGEKDEGRGT